MRRATTCQSLARGVESETAYVLRTATETSCALGWRGAVGLLDKNETDQEPTGRSAEDPDDQ